MAHLVGAARMGFYWTPQLSVAISSGRTHDIANLFVCDAASCPPGSANPGLTIQALRSKAPITWFRRAHGIFHSEYRILTTPADQERTCAPGDLGQGSSAIEVSEVTPLGDSLGYRGNRYSIRTRMPSSLH